MSYKSKFHILPSIKWWFLTCAPALMTICATCIWFRANIIMKWIFFFQTGTWKSHGLILNTLDILLSVITWYRIQDHCDNFIWSDHELSKDIPYLLLVEEQWGAPHSSSMRRRYVCCEYFGEKGPWDIDSCTWCFLSSTDPWFLQWFH